MSTINRNRNNILNLNCQQGQPALGANGITDGLPKAFVNLMFTLFTCLDDQKTGFIKLSDIEERWDEENSKNLPKGLIECLRKVTVNGRLSFEDFCSGLKICLLRNQNESKNVGGSDKKMSRPPPSTAAVLHDLENSTSISNNSKSNSNTLIVRPNNAIAVKKTLSLPKLNTGEDLDLMSTVIPHDPMVPPPKPPRVLSNINNTNFNQGSLNKAEIRNALNNWQIGMMLNENDAKDKNLRGNGDGQSHNSIYVKKSTANRHREPRRHTLQNGIDYNMLKRLKQIENEKEILIEGLTAVEKARDWYFKQIANVQDKIKYLGRCGTYTEQFTEAHQERLDFQRARVLEVNRHLMTLVNSWERGGFPMHMNLALRTPNYQYSQYPMNDVNRLKQQNAQLSEEINKKNEKVTLLEREKSNLIREVLQFQRGNRASTANDLVF